MPNMRKSLHKWDCHTCEIAPHSRKKTPQLDLH